TQSHINIKIKRNNVSMNPTNQVIIMNQYELDLYADYLMVTFGYATAISNFIRWRHKPRYVYKVLIKREIYIKRVMEASKQCVK
ncbi:MAG: hypothetical protein QM487_03845, partial [Candidatus Marithrix sp.]